MTNTELKKEALEKLIDFFREEEIPAVLETRDIPGDKKVDIINALFRDFGKGSEDLYSEFFFSPSVTENEDEVVYFNCVCTLADKLEEKWAKELLEILPVINFYAASGSFSINNTGELLAYKNCLAVPVNLSDSGFFDVLMANISLTLESLEAYYDIIIKCARGLMSAAEIEVYLDHEL